MPWQERLQAYPSVVFLGRLTGKKNPIALIHAFALVRASVPKAKLTIIGDGPLREKLVKRIEVLGLQSAVTILGVLDQEAAWNEMRHHWIYAQHSVSSISGDQEGFALSLAEAAAHELPVVSTWHNGIPENVIHGETGYLVREFDYEEMGMEKLTYDVQWNRLFY
ncbi:MAG: glycosyltransferase family 4 protein [Candidatus Marinimicrobia bacterium]|nr:glycosyltransferase family 4 protein [Candidatus Neomarinimicrobiota bacterium]